MIHGIHHFAIRCCGLEHFKETVHFYQDLLGLKPIHQWEKDSLPCVMLSTGSGCVEIFANGTERLPQGNILHIAFACDDPDYCIEKVKKEGYKVTAEPKDLVIQSNPPFPVRLAFCIGPVGEEVEFFKEK